jgi:hypothetical protein
MVTTASATTALARRKNFRIFSGTSLSETGQRIPHLIVAGFPRKAIEGPLYTGYLYREVHLTTFLSYI